LAQRAARLGAVFVHESRVFGTFALCGPSSTFFSVVIVRAEVFDNRATIGTTFAGITAGSHTVGDHPFGVFGAFTLGGPLWAAVGTGIGFARGGLFVSRAGGFFDLIGFTIAERAASTTAVGDHPVRVDSALVVFGPNSAVGIGGFALGFVGRAVGQSCCFGGSGFSFFGGSGFFLGGGFCGSGVCGLFVGFKDASTHLVTVSIGLIAVKSVQHIFQEFSAISASSIGLAGTASITVSNSFSKSFAGQGRAFGGNFKFQLDGGIDTFNGRRGKTSTRGIANESEGSKFVHFSIK